MDNTADITLLTENLNYTLEIVIDKFVVLRQGKCWTFTFLCCSLVAKNEIIQL